MIPVTKSFLPPKEEYEALISKIWESGWLTNMGPLANELEEKLKKHLNVKNLLFLTNGTIALQMAIKALDLKGEIITTPFSFVATTSSIVWEGCKPVFVDIDPESLNIDSNKIEEAITENTSAILATHVYGNPCDVIKIEKIAKKHNLKVIYDAAHAFGVSVNGSSIFNYGDLSICSLHATKIFHSVEGGLIFSNNTELINRIASMRNFGITGPHSFSELGINGKNSEFHAAMGLVNLKYFNKIQEKRNTLCKLYDEQLLTLGHTKPIWHSDSKNNFAYYPIILKDQTTLLKVMVVLEANKIYTRRYFYPSLASSLPYLDPTYLSVSDLISKKVLCLPLYFDLSTEDVKKICKLILTVL